MMMMMMMIIFAALPSWHSHCESSPSSFGECRKCQAATDFHTNPTNLCRKCAYRLL